MGKQEYLNRNKWKWNSVSGFFLMDGIDVNTAFSDKRQNWLMSIEDYSWWFKYRADVIIRLMDKYFRKNKLTLDIGGGNGYTSSVAKLKGYYAGIIEPNIAACQHAKTREIDEVNCGTVTEDSIIDDSLEQALLLDVLEHIEDDKAFIELLYRKFREGGILLVTVPAFACLWSSEDDDAGHFRRYRIGDLCNLLEISGFCVCYQSYFMGFLFFPILFVRVILEKVGLLKKKSKRTDEERRNIAESQFISRVGIINAVLFFFERIEMRLMRKEKRVPFGSSIIVVARKV